MSLSIGARPGMNNPGDLEVTPSNPNLYSSFGQSGVYSSPNGYLYPIFATAQDGWNALVSWIQNNVGSNDATSLTTPSEFASYFVNGPNSTAPPPSTWLSVFESALGISGQGNAQLSQFTPQQIASAVEHAEGTYSTFGGSGVDTSGSIQVSNGILGSVGNAIVNTTQYVEGGIGGLLGVPNVAGAGNTPSVIQTSGQNTAAGAASTTPQQIGQAVSSGVSAAVQPLTNWLTGLTAGSTITRVSVGIVAVILLAAGIFFLAGNKGPTINLGNVARLRGAVG